MIDSIKKKADKDKTINPDWGHYQPVYNYIKPRVLAYNFGKRSKRNTNLSLSKGSTSPQKRIQQSALSQIDANNNTSNKLNPCKNKNISIFEI